MALDYSTDVSSSFLEDNFLSAEDWGFQSDFIHKDVSSEVTSLESFGITLDSQHYHAQDDVSSDSSTKSWNGLDDDFASTVDVDVKGEPCSPQLSQCSTESQSSQILQHELLVKLESPPLTPPHEDYPSVASAHLNGYNQDNPNHFNLVDGSIQLPTTQTQNGFIVRSNGGNPAVPNQVHIMNGNIHKGHQIVNGNINLVPTSNGVLVGNNKCVPKVMMTTNGLANGIKVQVVNGGTKRLANGTIKSGGRISSRKGLAPAPKRDANGITIHPPIVPRVEGIQVNGVPATIAVTQMSAAKAIVFSQSANGGCNLKTSCQGTVPLQQTVTVSAVRPSLSPQPPEDISDGKEMMAWKRQQRMIKNRESASLSRKKKKEYVQLLEQKMQDVVIENEMLKEENVGLKKRLCALEEEVESLRCLSPSSPSMSGKYVTCLLTVILFIGVNLSPFSLLTSNTRNDDFILTSSHHGRSLLSFEGDFENASAARSSPDMADIIKDQYYNETLLRLHDESSQHLMRLAEVEQALLIQKALNCSFLQDESESTHSARLLDVLRKLAPNKENLHEEDGNKKKEKEVKSKSNEKFKKVRKERRKKMMKAQEAKWQMESDERSLQIYDSFFIRHYENLINSLERRDDTYYIVSFTRDHLLLPAMSHNRTQRPKMSLVMPAGGNASMWDTPKDHMTMMQIDCEVTNTRTISVPDLKQGILENETDTASSHAHKAASPPPSNHSDRPPSSRSPTGSFQASPPSSRDLPSRIKKFRPKKEFPIQNNVTKT